MVCRKTGSILLAAILIAAVAGCGSGDDTSALSGGGTSDKPGVLVSITVTPENATIGYGMSRQFTATGTYRNHKTVDITSSVTWSSSEIETASITDTGMATGIAPGSATITATAGGVSGATNVTVLAASLVSLAITPANPSITKGATQQFTATGTFSDSTIQDMTAAVTWNSSAPSVASISNAAGSAGLASGAGAGTTTITATSGSVSGTAALAVTAPAGGVATLSWNAPTVNSDGTTLNYTTGLATYKIYYGTSSKSYTQTVSIPNPGTAAVSHALTLDPGTYYFAVTAIDILGRESEYSNEAMKTI